MEDFNHAPLTFNSNFVQKTASQKYSGMVLNSKLNFKEHILQKIYKAKKGILILRKLLVLPRSLSLTHYKTFVRSHLEYGDVIYDQPNNSRFIQEIKSSQFNMVLAIAGAIKGSTREKLYQEVGLDSLEICRWYRKFSLIKKLYK